MCCVIVKDVGCLGATGTVLGTCFYRMAAETPKEKQFKAVSHRGNVKWKLFLASNLRIHL